MMDELLERIEATIKTIQELPDDLSCLHNEKYMGEGDVPDVSVADLKALAATLKRYKTALEHYANRCDDCGHKPHEWACSGIE